MSAVLLAIVAGGCTFLAVKLVFQRLERNRIRERITPHTTAPDVAELPPSEGRRFVLRLERLYGLTERRFAGTAPWLRLTQLVARADVAIRPVALLWLAAGGGLAAGLLLAAATGSLALVVVLPLLVVACTWCFLSLRARRRLRAFDDQLPELLGELASSLRAGHSLSQALQSVTEDAQPPARKELEHVIGETKLGRPLEDALADMHDRLPSSELRYVLTAITVQRQVGGSLASLFDLVATTVQERQRFERKVSALTASGRISAYVLIALPLALAAALSALHPGYLSPLFDTQTGRMLVVGASVLMVVGSLLLKKLVVVKGVSA
jgi:tight adherence protein B